MKRPVLWIMLALVLAASGFVAWYFLYGQGLNLAQLREKYGSRYEAKRKQLKMIADLLPPRDSVTVNTPAQEFNPKPIYDVQHESYNVEIAMYEQLLNPDVDLRAKKDVDLGLFEGGLIQNLRILGPRSVMSPNIHVTGKGLARYEAALNMPYLIVIRPVTFVRPEAVTKESYTPGMGDLEVFLVDVRIDKVPSSCRIKAESAKSTSVIFRKGESEKQSVESWAYSTLWEDARAKLANSLREITGGTFEFNKYRR